MYHLTGYGSSSSEKRVSAALPIFAKKRPRVALMAFSNSQGNTNSSHVMQDHRQDKSSLIVTAAGEDKENTGYSNAGRELARWR